MRGTSGSSWAEPGIGPVDLSAEEAEGATLLLLLPLPAVVPAVAPDVVPAAVLDVEVDVVEGTEGAAPVPVPAPAPEVDEACTPAGMAVLSETVLLDMITVD